MNVARRGARLCDKRSAERNTNGEGEASGSATQNLDIYFRTKMRFS